MADDVAPSSQVTVAVSLSESLSPGRRRCTVLVTCSTRLRVVGELRQRRDGDAEARLKAHVQGHGVNRLTIPNGKPEAGLAARDEGDAGVRRAGGGGDGTRDCRTLGVHRRRLGDALVPGHRLKLHRVLGVRDALGLDDAADRSRRPAQGGHAKVAQLPVDLRQRVWDLLVFDGELPGLAEGVLPRDGEGRRRAVEGEGVVGALPLGQRCRAPEAQPAPLRAAEGPHPDVQGGGGPQGDGGAVAGDGERPDEYPPSGDGLCTRPLRAVRHPHRGRVVHGRHRDGAGLREDGGHRVHRDAPALPREGGQAMTATTRPRPRTLPSTTTKLQTEFGNLYVTVSTDEDGEPFEVFGWLGKGGSFQHGVTELACRLISLHLRRGTPLEEVIDQCQGIAEMQPFFNTMPDGKSVAVLGLGDGIAHILKAHLRAREEREAETAQEAAIEMKAAA